MRRDKHWKIEYDVPDVPQELTDAGYNPLLATILKIRGYEKAEDARNLIYGRTIYDPNQILGMDKAAVRIKKAIQRGEKVAVYGDYDVDGITATALLTDYLSSRGVDVLPYIPDRNEEGYGLNLEALTSFKECGISLVITVDCGITSREESEYAKSLGMDLVVTDHHECKDSDIPDCCAVIDCKQPNDTYPNSNLAGVGMAFKLVCAIDGNENAMLSKYCDLLAVGTVADVMPLNGENRVFVKYGLEKIKNNPRLGIKALLTEAEINIDSLNATSISYVLAPRLNAAGRLGKAISAEKLLLSKDEKEAAELSRELCELNKTRQQIENEIWLEASKMLEGHGKDTPIVMANDTWHPGVIGIAASRLAEHFGVPAIMIWLNGETGKGSCRSYGGFNLFDALCECSDELVSFGGHALAAGLNIEKGRIKAFEEKITKYYINNKPETLPDQTCDLLITDPKLLSVENVKSLDLLEPYGNENPKPVFCMVGVLLEQSVMVGNGKHLKMKINCCGEKFDCIFFSCTDRELGIKSGDFIDIAFTPSINEFRGAVSVQLTITNARPHDPKELLDDIGGELKYVKALTMFKPEREDFIKLWKKSPSTLSSCPRDMEREKYEICKAAFEAAGLIDNRGSIIKINGKADLESTEIMKTLNGK